MAKITIEFTGPAQDLNDFSSALFETRALGAGTQKVIPGGGMITMRLMMMRKSYGIPQYIEITLSIDSGIPAEIAGNYIYDKLKRHNGENISIRINRREVEFNKGKLSKMIAQEITIHGRIYRAETDGPAR